MTKTLTHDEARQFYDQFGAKQDKQGWYENAAVAAMCRHAAFDDANAVLEFGCGTGKLAVQLLESELGPDSRYEGLDLSPTMVAIACERTRHFESRAQIRQTSGQVTMDARDGTFDRFVTCYVLDLLSPSDTAGILAEAHRVLKPGGLLCAAGTTHGDTLISKRISRALSWVHAFKPKLVGGCRPIDLREQLPSKDWTIRHHQIVRPFGIPSEVVVAQRR